jgi:hypothetical protein
VIAQSPAAGVQLPKGDNMVITVMVHQQHC